MLGIASDKHISAFGQSIRQKPGSGMRVPRLAEPDVCDYTLKCWLLVDPYTVYPTALVAISVPVHVGTSLGTFGVE